jgi:Flp pilus assembly protein TadG
LHAQESGVALVEFALVLPLLLLILIGMLDFGKIFNYWIDEAARYAVVNKNPSTGGGSLQSYIQQQADTPELRNGGTSAIPVGAQVCISFPNGTAKVGDPVEVTVSTDYHFIPFLGTKVGVASKSISGSSIMRLESPPTNYAAGCT